jgi:hypothetical protein
MLGSRLRMLQPTGPTPWKCTIIFCSKLAPWNKEVLKSIALSDLNIAFYGTPVFTAVAVAVCNLWGSWIQSTPSVRFSIIFSTSSLCESLYTRTVHRILLNFITVIMSDHKTEFLCVQVSPSSVSLASTSTSSPTSCSQTPPIFALCGQGERPSFTLILCIWQRYSFVFHIWPSFWWLLNGKNWISLI